MVRWQAGAIVVTASVIVGVAFAAEKGGMKSDRGTAPAPGSSKATPPPPATSPPVAEPTTTRFGDWAWVCRSSGTAGPACEGIQLLRRSGDGADLAQYRLTPTNDAAVLRLTILVPANARVDSPPRLVPGADSKDVSSLKWTVCTLGGCRAEADVRASELEALARAAPEGVGFTYLESSTRVVALPMVANGLPDLIRAATPKAK